MQIPDIALLLPPGLSINGIADRVGKLPGKNKDRFLQVANSGVVRSRYEPDGVNSLELEPGATVFVLPGA